MSNLRLILVPQYTLQRSCVLVLYLAVAGASVYAQSDRKDYFPLAVGSQWSYKGHFSSEGGKPVAIDGAARISGKAIVRGKEYYKYVITSKFSDVATARGLFEDVRYYRVDQTGIFILSGKDDDGPELLEIPMPIRAGLKWRSGTAKARAERAGTVRVGRHTYLNCLKFTYNATDGARSTEYYLAPGVGIIRAIYTDSTVPKYVMELTLEKYKQ